MKEKLTLSIEKETKKRAKRHARAIGKSISEMVEEFLNDAAAQNDDLFSPGPGTAAYELSHLIPESEKMENPDYEKLKDEALKEKYDLD